MFQARIFCFFSCLSLAELPTMICPLPSTLAHVALFCDKAAIRLWNYVGCCLLGWTVMSRCFLGSTPLVWILLSDCKACFSSVHWLWLGWSHSMCHFPVFLPCSPLVSWHVNEMGMEMWKPVPWFGWQRDLQGMRHSISTEVWSAVSTRQSKIVLVNLRQSW